MTRFKRFFDYEWNPVLFVLWSYSFSARNIYKSYKKRPTK
jgi:hypothetical protein